MLYHAMLADEIARAHTPGNVPSGTLRGMNAAANTARSVSV